MAVFTKFLDGNIGPDNRGSKKVIDKDKLKEHVVKLLNGETERRIDRLREICEQKLTMSVVGAERFDILKSIRNKTQTKDARIVDNLNF